MAKPLSIVSFQSHVAFGHVGNSAAVFALQSMGIEAWPVHTLQFSHHPGLGAPGGAAFDAAHLDSVVDGLARAGAFEGCGGVLSGYLGRAETAGPTLRAVAAARSATPDALYFCDPAFGDRETGLFTGEDVIARIADALVPAADIIFPNAFELGHLTGRAVAGEDDAIAAARVLLGRGPSLVVATGLDDPAAGRIATLAVTRDAAWRVAVPALDLGRRPDGAGDLFAAVFCGAYLATGETGRALGRAASATHGVLRHWRDSGGPHLPLIAARDELTRPGVDFAPERISG